MHCKSYELHGVRIVECAPQGPLLRAGSDAIELIALAREQVAGLLVIPVARIDAGFFRLRTGVAGEIAQKFVTYDLRVAIVGDISRYLAESSSLRKFVAESNRCGNLCFVATLEELDKRMESLTDKR